ncbi:MAG: sigma-70 family RNA polymerase sigma factor [Actinomycetota bacterium]
MTATLIPSNEQRHDRPSILANARHGRRSGSPSRCREGRGFDELYHRQYEPMVRLASGLVDRRAVAEEIVQDSFRRLWQRWDDVTTPAGYLRTSVVNGCHNELRRRRVRRDAWHKLVDDADESAGDYLADALAEISESRRTALVLRFYGGRTMDEIAEAMDIPTGTAKSLIHRGLADLRGAFH